MEEDVIYDLEAAGTDLAEGASHAEEVEEQRTQRGMEGSEGSEISEESENSDISECSEGSDREEAPADPAREEIERMVGEMGAETLLQIIRDNRNAAIRQIIREVEATQVRVIPSGNSAVKEKECRSIFDLAALA